MQTVGAAAACPRHCSKTFSKLRLLAVVRARKPAPPTVCCGCLHHSSILYKAKNAGTSLHCVLQYGDSPCIILSYNMSYSLLRLAVLFKTGIEEVDIFRDVLVV